MHATRVYSLPLERHIGNVSIHERLCCVCNCESEKRTQTGHFSRRVTRATANDRSPSLACAYMEIRTSFVAQPRLIWVIKRRQRMSRSAHSRRGTLYTHMYTYTCVECNGSRNRRKLPRQCDRCVSLFQFLVYSARGPKSAGAWQIRLITFVDICTYVCMCCRSSDRAACARLYQAICKIDVERTPCRTTTRLRSFFGLF